MTPSTSVFYLPAFALSLAMPASASAQTAPATGAAPCTAIAMAAADAASKADWIVEGKLQDAVKFSGAAPQVSLIFADLQAIKGAWHAVPAVPAQ